jgi:hypothetical protein
MIAADIYHPSQWNDFFVMVGSGTAALTGLVFVAMSLNLYVVFADRTHRSRAVGTLTSFAAVFLICAFALMGGQHHVAIGLEWLVVAGVAGWIYVYGYIRAVREGHSLVGLTYPRLAGGTACYVAQVIGGLLLVLGVRAGIYVAAIGMLAFFPFLISGAWLILLGVHIGQKQLAKNDETHD